MSSTVLVVKKQEVWVFAGGAPAHQSSHAASNFAGRMGNIMVNSMAGGFGGTLGSQAAHSLWNGLFR